MKRHRGSLSATSITKNASTRLQDIPAMVGRFLIEEVIGRGGMSDVYRAYDPQLGRDVALKVLSPALGRNPEFRDRFLRESRSAAQLNHPHVVPIFEAGNDGDTLFIAMQLVRGVDLKTHIEQRGPLPLNEVRSVIAQAAEGLDHAHQNGLLHRDVKPANLMLEERDDRLHVYLTDFGLTKSLGTDSRITHTGELVGSVHYVSPEHLEGRELDTRTDVYSLGCVLYEALAGRPPYERDTDMAILWAHLNAEPPRPSRERKDVPHIVDRVVARSLAKDPSDRYRTCADLVLSLGSALEGVAVDLPPIAPKDRPSLRARVRSLVGVIAAVVLLAASVAVATWDWSDPFEDNTSFDAEQRSPKSQSSSMGAGKERGKGEEDRLAGRSGPSDKTRSLKSVAAAGGARDSLAGSEESTYFDDKGTSLRLIRTRTERDNYDVRSNELGLAEQCPADDTSATGCTMFTLSENERYVDVVITDQTGRPVGAFIKQDYDDDANWDGAWISVCDETAEPVRVMPGARIQITIDADGCQGRSSPTLGTIVARVYRAA